jgi:hypothetical protein
MATKSFSEAYESWKALPRDPPSFWEDGSAFMPANCPNSIFLAGGSLFIRRNVFSLPGEAGLSGLGDADAIAGSASPIIEGFLSRFMRGFPEGTPRPIARAFSLRSGDFGVELVPGLLVLRVLGEFGISGSAFSDDGAGLRLFIRRRFADLVLCFSSSSEDGHCETS